MTKDEALKVLSDLIQRIDTQDSRCTAKPWFHFLEEKRSSFIPLSDDYSGNGGWWKAKWENSDECPVIKAETAEEAANILIKEHGYSSVHLAEPDEELEECCCIEWWETREVFLTEEGYKRHMKLNHYNYQNEVKDFMVHAYKNPEIEEVMAAIRAVVEDK